MATTANIDTALVARLLATPAVTDLVGDRIYGGMYAPQGTALPYITYQVDDQPVPAAQEVDDVSRQSRAQVWCHDASYGGCRRLSEAVRGALNGWVSDPDSISSFQLESAVPDQENPTTGEEIPIYLWQHDYIVWSGDID